MYRFSFYSRPESGPPTDLRSAYLVGADGVPVKGELRLEKNQIIVDTRSPDPIGICLLWRVPGSGTYQLETTRLMPRTEPYHLHIELVRHRLMRISIKREEWGLFDYPGMDEIAEKIDQARDLFVAALSESDRPESAAAKADQALSEAIAASESMCRFHAGVFLSRRQQSGGFARPFLGVNLGAAAAKSPPKMKLNDICDFVRVPFAWREIQPKEQGTNFDTYDALVKSCVKSGLAVRGGPLLNFGIANVPDWMYIWENDYEAISDFAREHIRRTVQRYAGQITNWIVASGVHAESAFAFTFEQIIDLTRMAVTITRQTAARSQILLELSQPWGEYYARNQRTVPPLLYAEMAVQSGIPFDAFGLQLLFGIDAEGFHLRDTLQVSALIDRLANLGKPIHITAIAVPNQGAGGGTVGNGWNDAAQADWTVFTLENILSKPYVDSVTLYALNDAQASGIPGGGLLRDDGTIKPVCQKLMQLRASLQSNKK